jgi:hypothetical protein
MIARACLRSLLLLIAVLLAALIGHPATAHACSCAMPNSPRESMERAAAVFAGRASAVSTTRRPFLTADFPFIGWLSAGERLVSFEVASVWKGNVTERQVVRTAGDEAMCGYSFERGRDYIVYAYTAPEGLATAICDRTRLVTEAGDDLAAFGPGRQPAPQPEETRTGVTPAAIVLSAMVVLGAIGLLVARRISRNHSRA